MQTSRMVLANSTLIFATLLVAGGCSSSPYVSGYAFYPQPAVVPVFHQAPGAASPQKPLTMLATVLGIRREDSQRHIPTSVEIRLRFENDGNAAVEFDPRTLELVTGTLRPFGPPRTSPPQPTMIPPGQSRTVMALFAFPPGARPRDMNLSYLRLRCYVNIERQPVLLNAYFHQAVPETGYDDYPPEWGP